MNQMMRLIAAAAMCIFSITFAGAQDVVGVWKTIDDQTNLPTSHVEIYKKGNTYFGKIVDILRDDPNALCTECDGDLKNKPIMGMVILSDMVKQDSKTWTSGSIIDPESGKEYKCKIYLKSNLSLTLRGYIGAPLFGRSQEWIRIK